MGKEERNGPGALAREWLQKNKKQYERSQYVIENKCGHGRIVGTKLRSIWKQRSYARIPGTKPRSG
jgi:hypothetical protein